MKIKLKKKLAILTFILVICLQNISVFLPNINTLGLIKTKAIAQEPIPTIKVDCSLNDSQKIVFSWKAENSDYVLIEGYDDEEHPLEGFIESSGTYDFIAVGSQNIIVRELKSCVFNSLSPTGVTTQNSSNSTIQNDTNSAAVGSGNVTHQNADQTSDQNQPDLNAYGVPSTPDAQTSVQGNANSAAAIGHDNYIDQDATQISKQILESSFPKDSSTLSNFFSNSYKTKIKTILSTEEIEERVLDLLQSWGYNVSSKIYDYQPLNNNLFMKTNEKENEKLCLDNDCNQPMRKRKIIRKISFNVWLAISNDNAYWIKIKPSVLRNYRKQDSKWNLDPDADKVSFKLCQELAEEIKKKINQVS